MLQRAIPPHYMLAYDLTKTCPSSPGKVCRHTVVAEVRRFGFTPSHRKTMVGGVGFILGSFLHFEYLKLTQRCRAATANCKSDHYGYSSVIVADPAGGGGLGAHRKVC